MAKTTIKARNFKEVSLSPFWIPEKAGDAIEGTLLEGFRTIATAHGDMDYKTIVTDDDEKINIGLSGGLRGTLGELDSGYIRVEYQGDKKNEKTKRTFKAFKVSVADEEGIPFYE